MSIRKSIRIGLLLLSLVMVFSFVLAGCTQDVKKTADNEDKPPVNESQKKDDSKNQSSGPDPEPDKVYTINFMARYYSGVPCPKDHPVELEMEKRTGVKLNIQWVSANSYGDKVNIAIASGDMPDLFYVWFTSPQFQNAAKQGAFWDITPYIPEYPNLAAIPEVMWKENSINGRNYGVVKAGQSLGSEIFFLYREDWRKDLGLEIPETMDDVYQMLKAFKNNDPDKNGKDDTFGLSGFVGVNNMSNLGWIEQVFTGAYGGHRVNEDGELENSIWYPEMRDCLLYIKKLYDEKLLTPDFAVLQDSQHRENAYSGKYGAWGETIKNGWRAALKIREAGIDEDADFAAVPYLISPKTGKPFAPYNAISTDILVIPKKVEEGKMKAILRFLDFCRTEEGTNLAKYGFQGEHWDYDENGNVVVKEGLTNEDMVWRNLRKFCSYYVKYSSAFDADFPDWFKERSKKIVDQRLEIATINPLSTIISPTAQEHGPDYAQKIQELKTKIIMGKEPIEAWDKYLEELKADPVFMKIEEEFKQAYKDKNAN